MTPPDPGRKRGDARGQGGRRLKQNISNIFTNDTASPSIRIKRRRLPSSVVRDLGGLHTRVLRLLAGSAQ